MDTAKVTATKIAANPQDHTWAQAYSTLKLYIVLSVEDASQKTVAATGKELLEKLQREFFALDEKSLEAIKNATVTVVDGLESEATISITLATIVSGTLYLVVVGNGVVILSRNGKNGVVAKGEGKTPTAFSGKLESGDNIALTTEEFLQKVPMEKIASAFTEGDLQTATESIVPLVHTDSSGKEAAILLHYVDYVKTEQEALAREDETLGEEQDVVMGRASALSMLPAFRLPNLKGILSPNILHDRKKLIILATLILVITLLGSLLFDKLNSQSRQRQETLAHIIDPLQKKYDDAISVASINSTLAIDELTQIKDAINQDKGKLPPESNEGKKLADFEAKINNKISELGGNPNGSASLKITYDSTKNTNLGTVVAITNKGEALIAAGQNGKVGTITDGNVSKAFDSNASNVKTVTADNTGIFILGDSIFKQPKNGGDATKIVNSPDGIISVDTFGGNVYGLSASGIDKFSGTGYAKSSYLKDDAKLAGSPNDMSIDASIWVIVKDGTIQKFTRGAKDDFSIKNLSKPFGQNPKIYTDIDYANVYVLDSANGRVVTVSKSGDAGREYKAKEMGHATSFAVDEPGKKLYILSGSKIYSLDL